MKEQISTPVLIIAFNRPEYLKYTFEKVRQASPKKLYFAVDGPRPSKPEDIQSIEEVKSFANKIDWDCDVHTLFRDKNVGCGYGPAEAISWAFQNEDQLIILEDDCVADVSFFQFCEEMLERYKTDTRIWDISGRSHQQGSVYFGNQDYVFSRYVHTCGWATWKRCWEMFDINASDYKDFLAIGGASNVLAERKQGLYFNRLFEERFGKIEHEVSHSWDLQWVYARYKNGCVGIVPKVNLIHNIGVYGTHSSSSNSCLEMEAHSLTFPLRHPQYIVSFYGYEKLHFNNHIKKIGHTWKSVVISVLAKCFPHLKQLYKKIRN